MKYFALWETIYSKGLQINSGHTFFFHSDRLLHTSYFVLFHGRERVSSTRLSLKILLRC